MNYVMQARQPNKFMYQFLKDVLIEQPQTSTQQLGVMMVAANTNYKLFIQIDGSGR